MPETMTDATLLTRALKGDRAAFTTLYDRHSGGVFGYALRIVRDPSAAEDVVQETFVGLLGGRKYDPSRPFLSWLLTIARNASIDLIRRRKVRKEVGAEDAILSRAAPAGPDADAREAVETALRQVPDEFREALWLCDAMGMSYQEASEVMGCETGTVGSRVARGRRMLREHFARAGHEV